jgi:CheY-like chemotaxis protein
MVPCYLFWERGGQGYCGSRSSKYFETTTDTRGDLTLLAATLNNQLKGDGPGASRWGLVFVPMRKNGLPSRPTVLVIDDDPRCRAAIAHTLQCHGCDILEASDGFQGISLLSRRGSELDLLLVDTEMPGVHGWEVIRFASRVVPRLRVVRLGRHDDLVPAAEYGGFQSLPVLQKPFTPSELRARMQIRPRVGRNGKSLVRSR